MWGDKDPAYQHCQLFAFLWRLSFACLGLAVTLGLVTAKMPVHTLSDGTVSFGGTLPALPPLALQHGLVDGPKAPVPDPRSHR